MTFWQFAHEHFNDLYLLGFMVVVFVVIAISERKK